MLYIDKRTLAVVSLVWFTIAPVAVAADAVWSADDPAGAGSLRLLSGADGVYEAANRSGSACVTTKSDTTPASSYLYFDLAESWTASAPVYVRVEYFDASPGGGLELEYDSTGDGVGGAYHASDDRWGGFAVGGEVWRAAVYRLDRPAFGGRQNLGADFRISGGPLYLRSVRVTTEAPEDLASLDVTPPDLEPRVRIGEGGELIIGGFDPVSAADVPRLTRALAQALPTMKAMGVTSHEGYVRWNLCEPEEGRYDWSVYDAFVEVYRKHNVKWVPFLIVGSAYSLPDWYYKKPGSQGYVCLEHGEESDVESLWNPVLRGHVARFIKAFCEHFGPTGVIESILLGITGNYGEAIYVVTGNDWTADVHGPYHTHPGIWAGDKYAIADFQGWLQAKYTDIERLNAAWGTEHESFAGVRPFVQKDAPNDRAWLDVCHWYIGAMTDWARFWMKETRANFSGEIYLCTGGHAPAEHGADFGDQCKIAAEVGGGVRITNEASDYAGNFTLTRWVASAGRQYGAYYSFEPAGLVTPDGVISRIYNATASGALGLHYYHPNIFGSEEATNNFVKWGGWFTQRKPVTEVAVYYPETHILLEGNKFLEKLQPVRDRFDFVYMSDGQIRDGGLASVRALILLDGRTSEAETWNAIAEWVRGGGVVLYATGMGRLRTVEGDESVHDAVLGDGAQARQGRAAIFDGNPATPEYRDFLSKELASAPELSEGTRGMVAADGREDKSYVTLLEGGSMLWLHTGGEEWSIEEKKP